MALITSKIKLMITTEMATSTTIAWSKGKSR